MIRILRTSLVAPLGPVIVLLLAFLPLTDEAFLGDTYNPLLFLLTLIVGATGLATALRWTLSIQSREPLPLPDVVKATTVLREVAVLWSAFLGSLTYLIIVNRSTGALPGAWFGWGMVAVGLATATRMVGTGRSDLQAVLGEQKLMTLPAIMRVLRRWERWYLAGCVALGLLLTVTILLTRTAGPEVAGQAVSVILLGALGVAYALIALSLVRNIVSDVTAWWRRRTTARRGRDETRTAAAEEPARP